MTDNWCAPRGGLVVNWRSRRSSSSWRRSHKKTTTRFIAYNSRDDRNPSRSAWPPLAYSPWSLILPPTRSDPVVERVDGSRESNFIARRFMGTSLCDWLGFTGSARTTTSTVIVDCLKLVDIIIHRGCGWWWCMDTETGWNYKCNRMCLCKVITMCMQRIECKRNNYSMEIRTSDKHNNCWRKQGIQVIYIKKLKQQQFPLDRVLSLSSPKTVMMSTSCPHSRPTLVAICTVCVCVVTITLS